MSKRSRSFTQATGPSSQDGPVGASAPAEKFSADTGAGGRASQLAERLVDRLAVRYEAGANAVPGLSTGFRELDRLTTGMHAGELIVVAGRPSMGKSALAMNVAQHAAVGEEVSVLVFSMEMERDQLVERIVSASSRIDLQRLRTAQLRDDEWVRFSTAVEDFGGTTLTIDDTPALSIGELVERAKAHSRALGASPQLVIVDYLQLMISESSVVSETRANQVGEISRGLKALARELQCPVIALSQLNRSLELRSDKRPVMSDLRDSGSIEEDADVIVFVYRDDYYTRSASKQPGMAELIIGKQRNGPTGTVYLTFNKPFAKFETIEV